MGAISPVPAVVEYKDVELLKIVSAGNEPCALLVVAAPPELIAA